MLTCSNVSSNTYIELRQLLSWSFISGFKIQPQPWYNLTFTGWIDENYDNDFETGLFLDNHRNRPFSTKDNEQDVVHKDLCAKALGGGWWYKGCQCLVLNNKMATGNAYVNTNMCFSLMKVRYRKRQNDESAHIRRKMEIANQVFRFWWQRILERIFRLTFYFCYLNYDWYSHW